MTGDEMDQATKLLPTKSAKIRTLARLGVTRGEIAKYLNIRYQHVRNVLVQPAPATDDTPAHGPRSIPGGAEGHGSRPLTIEEAKLGLAAHFGVAPSAIEITIRG
jgi:hypothetical protein